MFRKITIVLFFVFIFISCGNDKRVVENDINLIVDMEEKVDDSAYSDDSSTISDKNEKDDIKISDDDIAEIGEDRVEPDIDLPEGECISGETNPCGTDIGTCKMGTQTCTNGVWGECVDAIGAIDEICTDLTTTVTEPKTTDSSRMMLTKPRECVTVRKRCATV